MDDPRTAADAAFHVYDTTLRDGAQSGVSPAGAVCFEEWWMQWNASKSAAMTGGASGLAVAQALRGAGLTVDVLHDGVAAEHALASEDYALAVLDVGLPRLDGFEVLARVRGRGKTLPVLMLTAKAREVDIVRALELGADDYVTKPFQPEELLARIRRLLRGRR